MKKVLVVASVVSFIEWFNKENIDFLSDEMKCEVHIACNFDYMNDTDIDRTKKYIERLTQKGIILHNITFARSPFGSENIKAYQALKAIINAEKFDLIHCHTPTVSIDGETCGKKSSKKRKCCHVHMPRLSFSQFIFKKELDGLLSGREIFIPIL